MSLTFKISRFREQHGLFQNIVYPREIECSGKPVNFMYAKFDGLTVVNLNVQGRQQRAGLGVCPSLDNGCSRRGIRFRGQGQGGVFAGGIRGSDGHRGRIAAPRKTVVR